MKVQSHIYVYAFCLIAVFTGCKGTKMQKKNSVAIMMVNNANPGDSTAFSIFDNDSTYSFCLSKSEKVLGAGHVLDEDIVADSLSAVLIAKAAWYLMFKSLQAQVSLNKQCLHMIMNQGIISGKMFLHILL